MKGLYIHIPFCRKKCHYCNFVVTTDHKEVQRQQWLELFKKEVIFYAKQYSKHSWQTLYFGGGTPSMLTGDELGQITKVLNQHFDLSQVGEITLEANPEDIHPEKSSCFKNIGVNRISLGAQSFSDEVLKTSNRAHDALQIEKAFDYLRADGFDNINMDIILSLPKDNLSLLEKTLHRLIQMNPDHVSVYELVLEQNTAFHRLNAKGLLDRANEDHQCQMLQMTRQYLKKSGYRHYGLLNFAKPGKSAVHNLLYWTNQEYLGLGPGAWSHLDGKRFQMAGSVERYAVKMRNDDYVSDEQDIINSEICQKEAFLLALRLLEKGVNLSEHKLYAQSRQSDIDRLIGQGLLTASADSLLLSEKGILFAEEVFLNLS